MAQIVPFVNRFILEINLHTAIWTSPLLTDPLR